METAFLIILVLLVEFIYDPLVTLRDEGFIKKSYNSFHLYIKEYIEKKFFIYVLFSLFCILKLILTICKSLNFLLEEKEFIQI